MKIYKYALSIDDEQEILMPLGAEILTVQLQRGIPHLWAIVDDEKPSDNLRKILIIGTGHQMPKVGRYIGTFQASNGCMIFVWHVFETPIEN